MGRTRRRRSRQSAEALAAAAPAVPATPAPSVGHDRFMRFALAFLIIFVLLWLLAPQEG
ncbi:hypothetical protein OS242_06785 [Tumebacillus sp. DT12]|uniref:Preprotein translocase subunit SecG n=1 Tax=Tumebacillus lacus TaxID=2995335 RepID=A0ABT3X268_9BACL|nr:hypothetical protein [Tumebacillus lacus]MCX7569665.1 hypothetical protein [Tumebacillus lacus]